MIGGVCPKCAGAFRTKHTRFVTNGNKHEEVEQHKFMAGSLAVHFNEDSERVATTSDAESGEAAIEQFAFRYGITLRTAIEIHSEFEGRTGGDMEKVRELFQRMSAGLSWLIGYKGDMRMAARCMAFVLGFYDVAGCGSGSAVEVARACSTRKHRVSKATANKCQRSLEEYLNLPQFRKLPPAPGQRTEEARRNMSVATKEGWHERGKA